MADKQWKLSDCSAPEITVATSQVRAESTDGQPSQTEAKKTSACVTGTQAAIGQHLIVDFWGARYLSDPHELERVIKLAVAASGATLLHIHLHHFNSGDGVTGVALLAESHVSVHTWPENDYAAFDLFMCGKADPGLALDVLRAELHPARKEVHRMLRG